MNKIIFQTAVLTLFAFSSGQLKVAAFDAEEYGSHLREMRSSLPKESQEKFDRLWQQIATQRKQKNFLGASNAFVELLQLIPESVPTWEYAAWSIGHFWFEQEVAIQQKYRATRQAILFLLNGVQANPDNPILLKQLAWYTGQKLGMSEHKAELRALFRKDKKLHRVLQQYFDIRKGIGIDGSPDNWLVARLIYEEAIKSYAEKGHSIGDSYPPTFCSSVPLALSKYADCLAEDGHFGQETLEAWKQAAKSWDKLDNRPFESKQYGVTFRLRDKQRLEKVVEGDEQAQESIKTQYHLAKYGRVIVNIDDWQQLCEVEQSEPVRKARKSIHLAFAQLEHDYPKSNGSISESTQRLFDAGFQSWAKAYQEYDGLIENGLLFEDVSEAVNKYRMKVLSGDELPPDFPLSLVIAHWEQDTEQQAK